MNNKVLNFKDVLVIIVTALIFSLFYKLVWFPYELIKPLGLQLNNLVYGVWFMAGPFAMLLIRKPGAAVLGEMGAALIEVFLAGGIGIQSFVYGGFQGLAAEFAYAAFAYRQFTLPVTLSSAIFTTAASLAIDSYYGYLELEYWALLLTVLFRTIGALLIAGWLVHELIRLLEKTGVVQLVRPMSKKDFDILA